MTDLATLVAHLQADNSQYIKALDQSTKKLQKFSDDQNELLTDIAKKFAAAFTVDAIAEFSAASLEAAGSLSNLSQRTGIAVEQISALKIAMAGSGVNTDQLAEGFKKLNESISEASGDGASKAGIAFKVLGINVNDASGKAKSADQIFAEVSDKFKDTADGANKVALATAIGGKGFDQLIPKLNEGSAALAAQKQAAIDAGAVVGPGLAEAADQAITHFAQLKATITGQLQVALAQSLTPALNDVTAAFKGSTNGGDLFGLAADGIALAFRVVASLVLEAGHEIQNLETIFKELGGYAAAAAQVVQGNFKQAGSIIDEMGKENTKSQEDFAKRYAQVWSTAGTQVANSVAKASGGAEAGPGKDQLASLAAAQRGEEGLKSLQEFSAGLQKQADTYGLGTEAATKFALAHGKLADDLKAARNGLAETAAAANKEAAAALAAAHNLQVKIDTKTITDFNNGLQQSVDKLNQSDVAAFQLKVTTGDLGKAFDRLGTSGAAARQQAIDLNNALIDEKDQAAVQALTDKIDEMSGKLAQAAGHAFDLQNKSLTQNLTARGDTAGLATVATAKQKTEAEASYQELVVQGEKYQQQFATTQANIQLQQAQGALTDNQAQEQLNEAQSTEITQLALIYQQRKAISDVAGIDKLTQQTNEFAISLKGLQQAIDPVTKQIRDDLENSIEQPLLDVETGAKSAKAAFSDFIKSMQKDLLSIVNKDIAQSLFGSGGAAGGLAPFLSGIFGGAGSSGASAGGIFGGIGSLFGGAKFSDAGFGADAASAAIGGDSATSSFLSSLAGFASGGTIPKKGFAIVGENGPEIAYAGSQDMRIQPMSGGSGVTVAPNFYLSAPGGTITRQSQTQAASEIARQVSIAARRNG